MCSFLNNDHAGALLHVIMCSIFMVARLYQDYEFFFHHHVHVMARISGSSAPFFLDPIFKTLPFQALNFVIMCSIFTIVRLAICCDQLFFSITTILGFTYPDQKFYFYDRDHLRSYRDHFFQ